MNDIQIRDEATWGGFWVLSDEAVNKLDDDHKGLALAKNYDWPLGHLTRTQMSVIAALFGEFLDLS